MVWFLHLVIHLSWIYGCLRTGNT